MITLITDSGLKRKLSKLEYENRLKILVKNGLKRIIIRDDKNVKSQMDTLLGIHKFAFENRIELFINCSIDEFTIFKDINGVTGIHLSSYNIDDAINSDSLESYKIGTSVHNMEEVTKVVDVRPYYALISPIYETVCKIGAKPLNIEKGHDLINILMNNQINVVALGGINSKNISHNPECVKYFKEVAIRSLFYESECLHEELKSIVDVLIKG